MCANPKVLRIFIVLLKKKKIAFQMICTDVLNILKILSSNLVDEGRKGMVRTVPKDLFCVKLAIK
jgi:hypothetical protein